MLIIYENKRNSQFRFLKLYGLDLGVGVSKIGCSVLSTASVGVLLGLPRLPFGAVDVVGAVSKFLHSTASFEANVGFKAACSI